ncbi:MAG: tRNA (guanosine(46)-N7)-methyltransferase TrmB [Gammaproteobacteria bacterium]|nr:tRNA (guanosine(46)-N7)-methyltransferase TrmB [Gammaproteobacteria bacterium]
MTRGQSRALEQLGERFVLSLDQWPDQPAGDRRQWIGGAVFGRDAPLGLEIGFGMGHALLDWAVTAPDWNLLGVEVYQPGIGSALLGIERHGLANLRLVEAAAEDLLAHGLPSGSLAEVRIFFPDPWPKKRHHKRRLVQPSLAALVADRLEPGGLLWAATDWAEYAEWIVEVLDAEPQLERERAPRVDDPDSLDEAGRPRTRFEARGLRLGHRVWDLRYRRKR